MSSSPSVDEINEANRRMARLQHEVECLTLKCSNDGGRRNHRVGEEVDALLANLHQIKLHRNRLIKHLYSPLSKTYRQ